MKADKRAVVLLSGGLDSATTLYYALSQGCKPFCLVFDYGQRHGREIEHARMVARRAGCPVELINIRLPWKGSSLLDRTMAVAGKRQRKIPDTYVPARNIIFLSFALSYAEAVSAGTIYIGANAVDYSGYPDCRPQFYRAFAKASSAGTRCGVYGRPVKIATPLIGMTKAQIILLGMRLGVPYELTWSCYAGGRRPCGTCDSCRFRAKGFRQAGIDDPALGKLRGKTR